MKKQTVQEKINEIIDYLKDSTSFNRNLVMYEAMEYANKLIPNKLDSEYLDFYTYEITKNILEKVTNVLSVYAEEGKYLFIEENKPEEPNVSIGDIRYLPHNGRLVKMILTRISYEDPKVYTFANLVHDNFVRPMVIKLPAEKVDLTLTQDQVIDIT